VTLEEYIEAYEKEVPWWLISKQKNDRTTETAFNCFQQEQEQRRKKVAE
jgi:hypothetical protein